MIEAAWRVAPHPDLAKVYLDLRRGESHADRLARARTLRSLRHAIRKPHDPRQRAAITPAIIKPHVKPCCL